jgi:hypothetical protein
MLGFLILLCREDDKRYQSFNTAENMCSTPWKFSPYEIVRSKALKIAIDSYTI